MYDFINLQNFLLARDSLRGDLPTSLKGKMKFVEHVHATRSLGCLQLFRPRTKTVTYGSKSINVKSIDIWNSINKVYHSEKLHEKSRSVCKNFVTRILISKYWDYRLGWSFARFFSSSGGGLLGGTFSLGSSSESSFHKSCWNWGEPWLGWNFPCLLFYLYSLSRSGLIFFVCFRVVCSGCLCLLSIFERI